MARKGVPIKMLSSKAGMLQGLQVRVVRKGFSVSKDVNNLFLKWDQQIWLRIEWRDQKRGIPLVYERSTWCIRGIILRTTFHQVIKRQLHKKRIRSVCRRDYLPHVEEVDSGWKGKGESVWEKIFCAGFPAALFYTACVLTAKKLSVCCCCTHYASRTVTGKIHIACVVRYLKRELIAIKTTDPKDRKVQVRNPWQPRWRIR